MKPAILDLWIPRGVTLERLLQHVCQDLLVVDTEDVAKHVDNGTRRVAVRGRQGTVTALLEDEKDVVHHAGSLVVSLELIKLDCLNVLRERVGWPTFFELSIMKYSSNML